MDVQWSANVWDRIENVERVYKKDLKQRTSFGMNFSKFASKIITKYSINILIIK